MQRNEVPGAEIAAHKRNVVRANQFIVSRIDARNGAFGLVPESLDGAVVSSDFPAFSVDCTLAEPRFLEWLSKTPGFVDLCVAASEGTTNRVRLKEDRFLAMTVPLPALDEQRRIVARIEAVAAKIEEARWLLATVDEASAALITSLHYQLSGERIARMHEILKLDEDKEPVQFGHTYPQVGVRGFGQGLFSKDPVDASATTYKAFNRLYAGAVVLSQVKGWEGAIAVCDQALAGQFVSPEYRTFRCIPNMADPQYFAALVRTPWFWGQLAGLTRGQGARRERVRPELFLNMELPMPEIADQVRAIAIFDRAQTANCLRMNSAAELDALLPSVLDRAFKGEL